jgi:chloramphenicol-sensitive protein RarD
MPPAPASNERHALYLAISCYVIWGIFPIYWKQLAHLPSMEILAHRMIWAFVFYLGIVAFRHWRQIKYWIPTTKRDWLLATASATLLFINWGVYIYAVNTDRILQGSLAYFINPLMSVVVGVWLFKESFPTLLKVAFGLALAGVGIQIFFGDEFPWIALILATSFCVYGAVKKITRTAATQSSFMEGTVGLLPALILAIYIRGESTYVLTSYDWLLLLGGGVVTGLPLFLFAIAAKQLPLSLIGMLQFIGPTLQFAVGVWMYGETLHSWDIASFGLIWAGVAFYLTDKIRTMRANARPKPLEAQQFVDRG